MSSMAKDLTCMEVQIFFSRFFSQIYLSRIKSLYTAVLDITKSYGHTLMRV